MRAASVRSNPAIGRETAARMMVENGRRFAAKTWTPRGMRDCAKLLNA